MKIITCILQRFCQLQKNSTRKIRSNKSFHLTASPRGFYVNRSDFAKFDPLPAEVSYLSHSLADLMAQLSPAFKKNWAMINRRRCALHPFERLPTNYQLFSWLAPREEHQVGCPHINERIFSVIFSIFFLYPAFL